MEIIVNLFGSLLKYLSRLEQLPVMIQAMDTDFESAVYEVATQLGGHLISLRDKIKG
jgi:hypothetical protein